VIREASRAADTHNIFWDLDPDENPQKVRKAFLYVAGEEGINLKVRSKRDSQTLKLVFSKQPKSGSRMSAKECRERIVSVIGAAQTPLQKAEIISKASISPSTWNVRIKELLSDGTVSKAGKGRRTRYSVSGV
jgi:hypothetical protein